MTICQKALLVLGGFALFGTAPLSAATLVFTNEADWLAAITSGTLNTYNFGNTGPVATPTYYNTINGLQTPWVQVIGRAGNSYYLAVHNPTQSWLNFGTGALGRIGDGVGAPVYTTVNLRNGASQPGSYNAFAVSIGGRLNSGTGNAINFSVTSTANGFTTVTGTTPSSQTLGFLGVISDDTMFSNFTVWSNTTDSTILIDNIRFGTGTLPSAPPPPSEVPEASTVLYSLSGITLLALARLRKQGRA